jgi:SAM-dependent methyltransferase
MPPTLAREFEDAAAALAWIRERERSHPTLYDVRRHVADRLAYLVGRRARLLDVGGAAALQTEMILARLADAACVWIDPSPEMRVLAEARLAHRSECFFRTGVTIEALEATRESAAFDAAWAIDAFGARANAADPKAVHAAVFRRLAPGGRYFVCEPYAAAPDAPDDGSFVTVDAQEAAIASAGFEVGASLTLVGAIAVHEMLRPG